MNTKLHSAFLAAILAAILSILFIFLPNNSVDVADDQIESRETSSSTEAGIKQQPDVISIETPESNQLGSIYQIWLRSFYDSNNDGHGDLAGVIEKFDYIKALSPKAILLSPIFDSPSIHGYDPTDYLKIHPQLGNLESFKKLVKLCQQANINLWLDLPFNHTSEFHPWFKQSLKQQAPYTDYYVWKPTMPSGYGLPWSDEENNQAVWHSKSERKGFYYGVFGYGNPDLNYNNPNVVAEIKNVLKYWIGLGVTGFRVDAARYLTEEGGGTLQRDTQSNQAVLANLINYSKAINPEVQFVGETFTSMENSLPYLSQGMLDGVYNFEYFSSVRDLFGTDISVKASIIDIYKRLAQHIQDDKSAYIFLSNHDIDRVVASDNVKRILAAITILSPFDISIYYGEELGLTQYKQGQDLYRRATMPWSLDIKSNGGFNQGELPWADQAQYFPWLESFEPWTKEFLTHSAHSVLQAEVHNNSLLNLYRKLMTLKKTDVVLSQGGRLDIYTNNDSVWLMRYRNNQGTRWLIQSLDAENSTLATAPTEIIGNSFDLISAQQVQIAEKFLLQPAQTLLLNL